MPNIMLIGQYGLQRGISNHERWRNTPYGYRFVLTRGGGSEIQIGVADEKTSGS
jgi:hypothetical protein